MESERTLDLQAAFDEAGWLRALAVRLVGTTWADDVVQDTYLAALAREDAPREWRSWLGRVAQRIASNTRRREARLTALKERVADRAESASDTAAQLHERLHLQRLLLQAVDELEPDFCAVVVGCYMDGLTPSELAAQLGIPAGTVRSRLSRALDKLRAKLDDELGRDRWLGALLPWALPNALPPGLPHTLPLPNGSAAALSQAAPIQGAAASLFGVIGGLSMTKWMSAALVAVVASVLVWNWGMDPGDVKATPAAGSPTIERAVATLEAEPERKVAVAPVEPTSNRVEVGALVAEKASDATPAELNLRTAEFVIVDGATQRPLAGVELIELDTDLMTARHGEINGHLGAVQATSDAGGSLRYTYGAKAYPSCMLRRAGYAELFLSSALLGDNGSEYALEMWPAQRFTVRVSDSFGAPVKGAEVNVLADTDALAPGQGLGVWGFGLREDWDGCLRRTAEALTNDYGETELIGFNEQISLRIEVRMDGVLVYSGKDLKVRNERIEIRLPAASSIRGVLRDSLGVSLANVSLFLGAYDDVMPVGMSTKTDALGRFDFAPVPMGEDGVLLDWIRGKDYGMLTVLSNGELLRNVQLDWKTAVDGVLELDLQTEPAFSISGAVFDANGAPVTTDGLVWVERDGLHVTGVPTKGGQFVVPGLARGEYWLGFSVGGGPQGERVAALAGDTDVRLEAMSGGDLTLELVPVKGSPAGTKIGSSMMVIGWRDQGGVPLMSGILNEPQTFKEKQSADFYGCAPGQYRFVVRGLSGMIGYADFEVVANTQNVATIPMQPEARVQVELPGGAYDEVGFLVAGRQVGWRDTDDQPAIVPAGAITVRWLRDDGDVREVTVVAVAGETVTARFD